MTDATLGNAPVLLVANESWIRVWDANGQLRIDKPHDEVTVLRGQSFGSVSGVELLDIPTGRRTALDNVGPGTWVDDLLWRIEADPDESTSPETDALGPVLGEDGLTRCPLCAEEIQPGAKICRFCRTDFRATDPPGLVAESGPRFVGEAEVGGVTVRRLFDAGSYALAGIAFIVLTANTKDPGLGVVLGIGAILYGAKITLTTTSYWVSSIIYVAALVAVVAALGIS